MNSDGEGMIKGAMRIPSMWYMQRMIARKQDQDVYALYFLNVVVNLVQGVQRWSEGPDWVGNEGSGFCRNMLLIEIDAT